MSQAEFRQLFAARAHTFFFAARFLPADRQEAVTALYAFCRVMDDLADELPVAEGAPALDAWDRWLVAVERGDLPPAAPPLPQFDRDAGKALAEALLAVVRRHAVPVHYLRLLIDGVRSDTTRTSIRDFAELRAYCYRVAGTVGLAMCHVLGAADAEACRRAERLGIAMQLTNVLRDVGEDAQRGRVYLPADEMARFGVLRADLEAQRSGDAFVALMQHQVARARVFYDAGLPGVSLLPRECRLPILIAGHLYRAILDRIEAQGYDVFARRAATSRWQKALTAGQASFALWQPSWLFPAATPAATRALDQLAEVALP